MICTSSYKNWQSDKYTTYSISGNRGKDAGYTGKCFPELAPKLSFWKTWHDNIGVISEEENNRYYVEQYYEQVLSKLDPEEIYKKLDRSALLCYEENTEFCHRHIVAGWLELLLGIEVPEQKADDYYIEEIGRPKYIREYLESTMRKNRNMRGFNSLRALYLFEKGEELEQKAREIDESDSSEASVNKNSYKQINPWIACKQEACYLRCQANEAEKQYNKRKRMKIMK